MGANGPPTENEAVSFVGKQILKSFQINFLARAVYFEIMVAKVRKVIFKFCPLQTESIGTFDQSQNLKPDLQNPKPDSVSFGLVSVTEFEARFTESKTRFSFIWFGFGFVLIRF